MDLLETIGGAGAGVLITGIIGWFTLAGKSRKYIRDAVGKNEEIDVNVRRQPLEVRAAVIYAEKHETDQKFGELENQIDEVEKHFDLKMERARSETKSELEKMRDDAVAGRRLLHAEIKNSGEKITTQIIEMTNAVGELRGEIRGMNR